MSTGPGGAAAGPGERWIDAHCHLQDRYRQPTDPVEALVGEAWAAGVVGAVCVGVDPASSLAAVELAERVGRHPGRFSLWATVGVHPHEAATGTAELGGVVAQTCRDGGPVVAIGECGLDYHYDHAPRHQQRQVFADQVALAGAHHLALVVHTREAWDDTVDILRAVGPPDRTVLHCFTGGPVEARRCLNLGAYLSFSGIVTFRGATDVQEAARLCPADRLLVETDAPFLAPVPHRGRPNRPAWVAVVGRAVAGLRGVPAADLAATVEANTRAAFALPAPVGPTAAG